MGGFLDPIQALWDIVLPEGAHLYAWGALAGVTAAGVFFLLTDHRKVAIVREEGHRARMAALQFDGEFAELWPVLGRLLGNAFHNVWLRLIPIVLASVPFVALMPWMQDRFAHVFPASGDWVVIEVSPPGTLLATPGSTLQATDDTSRYRFQWPVRGQTVEIRDRGNVILATVPPETAKSSFVRTTAWSALLENPPHLPRQSAVESLNLGMPARQYMATGHDLLDGWEFHFTVVALLAAAAGYLVLKRLRRSNQHAEGTSTGPPAFYVDPMTHLLGVLAGRWPRFWISMGRLESRRLGARLSRVEVDHPVFIAGLARGGTTILLEFLARVPGVVTHRYRDYPFVLVPYWWSRILDLVPRRREKPIERSHGDGIFVTSQSPEAMEEIVWMAFFPDLHDPQRSGVVDASCADGEFAGFFRDNIRKVLLVRKGTRYVSKENYNITRLRCLIAMFPDARLIVPIRHPVSHIASINEAGPAVHSGSAREPLGADLPRNRGTFRVRPHPQADSRRRQPRGRRHLQVLETRRGSARLGNLLGSSVRACRGGPGQ